MPIFKHCTKNKRRRRLTGFVLLFGLILPCSAAVAAEQQVTVTIPTFDVTLNDRMMDGTYSKYPLLVYKDITYFPMTYYDSRLLSVKADWSADDGLVVTKEDGYFYEYMREINEKKNKTHLTAKIAEGKITVNGKVIDNAKEEYPLLICRDVTYFPLTWRFAAEEFGWNYDFTQEKGLVIRNDGVKQEDPNEYEWEFLVGYGGAGNMNGVEDVLFPIYFLGEQPEYTSNEGTANYNALAYDSLALYNTHTGCDVIIQPMAQWEYQVYRLMGDKQELLYWRKVPFYAGELPYVKGGFSFVARHVEEDLSFSFWSGDNVQAGNYLVQLIHPDEIIYEEVDTHAIKHTPIKSGEPVGYKNWGFQLSTIVTITQKPLPTP